MPPVSHINTIGLFGFGQFGRLIAKHLSPHFQMTVHDPHAIASETKAYHFDTAAQTANCDLVILAVPVSNIASTCQSIRSHLKPGCIVMDVGSVKMTTAKAMQDHLPADVDLIGTHPLFGPQSATGSLSGRKIALCNIRGQADRPVSVFLRRVLHLQVYSLSPEDHDREAAVTQGLTHLIAKVLTQMGPLPTRMTTVSFDLLLQATAMVRHDPPNVFSAIEEENPFAADVRNEFLALVADLGANLRVTSPEQ